METKEKISLSEYYDLLKEIEDDNWKGDWDIESPDQKKITKEDEQFAQDIFDMISSFIENEDLDEEFVSSKTLAKHYKEHCLDNVPGRKSTKVNIFYDFKDINIDFIKMKF